MLLYTQAQQKQLRSNVLEERLAAGPAECSE